jgi:hypothetical protein
MATNNESGAVPVIGRLVLGLAIAIFLVVQGRVLLGAGGIASKYTFIQGFTVFNDLMLRDPLTTAGLIDLSVLELVFIVILVNGLPRGRNYPWLLAAFVIVTIIYPGLGGLAFLLFYWRRLGQFRP